MWNSSLFCVFLAGRQTAWICTWLSARDTVRPELSNLIFTWILYWGADTLFLIIISPTALPYFPVLERIDIFQGSPAVQVAAEHFRPRVQTCHRLCGDQLNECVAPTEPAPLKVPMESLAVQHFRLCSFFNICKAEVVEASLQFFLQIAYWHFPKYLPSFSDTVLNKTFPYRSAAAGSEGDHRARSSFLDMDLHGADVPTRSVITYAFISSDSLVQFGSCHERQDLPWWHTDFRQQQGPRGIALCFSTITNTE